MKALAAILENIERIHIFDIANGVQLNVMYKDSSGWSVTTAGTLERALKEQFTTQVIDHEPKEDPFE